MGLANTNGTQLQGINQQGIDINKDHISVNIDWIDPTTKQYFDPTTASITATRNGSPFSIPKVMTPLQRADDTVGVWLYEFLSTGMDTGDYVLTFTGSRPADNMGPVTITLNFNAAEVPVEQYFVNTLRAKLWDKRASRYVIDDNSRFRWKNGELYSFCDNALKKIGQTPPAPSLLNWNQGYSECHDLILTGGFIEALEAAGIFETWNRFTYSDELSLNVDRSQLFQNAQSLRTQWLQAVMMWKRDYMFHRVRGVGMASGKFPMYYSRVMSLSIANGQNMFRG